MYRQLIIIGIFLLAGTLGSRAQEVHDLDETVRGAGGFGSSGTGNKE